MLAEIIKRRIRESGPITVCEFMQAALYDPKHGYYTTQDPFGRGGDFITAPEISQMFGEMVGLWIADYWFKAGSPKLRLVECGPGRGTLMQDILRATRNVPELHTQLEVVMVEISPRLKALQQQALHEYVFIEWQPNLNVLKKGLLTIIIGNEFLDALPIKQFADGMERRVGLDEQDRFYFIGSGAIREECAEFQLIAREAARLNAACLFIDYGYEELPPPEGTLQAVKAHHYHPIFEDVGTADITALVDFGALGLRFKEAGLRVFPLLTQGLFLERMGIHLRLKKLELKATAEQKNDLEKAVERLISPDQMGTLFKVFCATPMNSIIPHAYSE